MSLELAIVGGGPAGLATALFLVHAAPSLAERVVVLEKEHYPREKYCGGAIGARADDLLASIGVQVEVPSAYVSGLSVKGRDTEVAERLDRIGRVVRRIEYDHALAKVAIARGIRIEQGAAVRALEVRADGVTLDTTAGAFRAQAVVGADGVGSFVRRVMGLPAGQLRAQVIEVDTERVSSDPARDLLHFDLADRDFTGYEWDFPTVVDGRQLVCRGVYHLKLDDRKVDIRARLERRLRERGLSLDPGAVKRYAERGFEPHLAYSAPRVMLVGEAAGIDAITGEGIAQAIEYASVAGPYLAEKLRTGEVSFRDWTERVSRSKVGTDLRIRHWLLPYYFGKHRPWFEHVAMQPELVRSSVAQFAGKPTTQLEMARATASAAVSALGEGVSRLWRRVGR